MTADYPDWADPQAVAAAIATGNPGGAPGGVPLLHGQSALFSQNPIALSPGGTFTQTVSHINIGYEVFAGFQGGPANPNSQCTLEVIFMDTNSGFIIDTVGYAFWPSDLGAPVAQQIIGKGPTRGNQMKLRVHNPAGVGTLQWQAVLLQSGRPYLWDTLRPLNFPNSASGRNAPSMDAEAGILAAHFKAALAAGTSQVDQLPPYSGKCHIHFDSASAAADCEVNVSAVDDTLTSLSSGIVYDQFTDGTGNRDADIVLPSAQCFITITNHNAANKDVRYIITETPY